MCFFSSSSNKGVRETPAVPNPNPNASLMAENRLRLARSQGSRANIFTTALGDSGFGSSVINGATQLGQTQGTGFGLSTRNGASNA